MRSAKRTSAWRAIGALFAVLILAAVLPLAACDDTESTPTPTQTATPTAQPTVIPTPTQTATPTAQPTVIPTPTQTATPTAQPTVIPTPTQTATPTAQPTVIPTPTQTATPTAQPTVIPTSTQTATPTAQPTVIPTPIQTATPTAQPTVIPTPTQTATPTAQPTVTPTPTQTATPTAMPSPVPTPTPIPEPTPADGICRVGLTVRSGESCTYPGTSVEFSVDSSGRGQFLFFTAGTGIDARNTTVNGVTYNFKASKQSDGSWIIEAAGGDSTAIPAATPTPPPTAQPTPTPESTAVVVGDCRDGMRLDPGEGCRYTGGGSPPANVVLSVLHDGSICREGGPAKQQIGVITINIDSLRLCVSGGFERDDAFQSEIVVSANADGSWTFYESRLSASDAASSGTRAPTLTATPTVDPVSLSEFDDASSSERESMLAQGRIHRCRRNLVLPPDSFCIDEGATSLSSIRFLVAHLPDGDGLILQGSARFQVRETAQLGWITYEKEGADRVITHLEP